MIGYQFWVSSSSSCLEFFSLWFQSIMMSSQLEPMGGNIFFSVVALQSSIFQKKYIMPCMNLEVVHELTWPPLPCSSQPYYAPIATAPAYSKKEAARWRLTRHTFLPTPFQLNVLSYRWNSNCRVWARHMSIKSKPVHSCTKEDEETIFFPSERN